MAKKLYEESSVQAIADAIRAKNGSTDTYKIAEMPTAISAIQTGGGGGADSQEDAIIQRTISGAYANDRITTVGKNAFFACLHLELVDFPNVTSVNNNAFTSCNGLTTVSAPKLTTIGQESFSYTTRLAEHTFALVTTIGTGAFKGCGAPTLIFPLLAEISTEGFRSSTVTRLDFGACTSISRTSFTDAKNLETLIIRTASVCTIAEASVALRGTKIAAGTGYIYVPDDLVDDYKAATNWATYAAQIKAISELEAES